MAITYGRIKDNTLRLIDEYSSRGVAQALSKTADYNFKIQSLVNSATYDLASTTAKLPAVFYIMHNPIQNRLSDDTSSIKTHIPGTDFSITLTSAGACFFEAIGPATIVIEESADGITYTNIETITVASTVVNFTEYRRLISPSASTNTIRLRFTGDYIYSFRNYILYQYTFPDEDSIQQHKPYFEIDVPSDFLDINSVFIKRDSRQYLPYSNYNISPGPTKKFSYNSYEGPMELEVNYWRKPTLLTFTQDDTTDRALSIDLTDEAALIIPWNSAGEILKSEGKLAEGTLLINQFEVKKNNLITDKTGYQGITITPYGW